MASKTRTISLFSSTIATRKKSLTLEEAPTAIEVVPGGGHGVRTRKAFPSLKGMFWVALSHLALMAVITSSRYGLLHEVREPYRIILRRVTASTAHNSLNQDATSGRNLETVYEGPSRVWQPFNGGMFPCFPGERHLMSTEPAHHGFLFHRPKKVGSTTMVGIILRLVHNKARQEFQQQQQEQQLMQNQKEYIKCMHRAMHGSALDFEYNQRDISQSFLFSLLRHPTQRAISEFFHFRVAVHGQEPTNKNFMEFVRQKALSNYYLNDMTMKPFDVTTYGPEVTPLTTIVQDVLNSFDFMAITERMNESLVVLQMLLGLETKDIVYTRARSSGTFTNGPPDRPCSYITPSFLTSDMKQYFASEEWLNTTRGDVLLYNAASASLDRTIDALGRGEFTKKLHAFERGLSLVEENCKQGKDHIVTLCTEGGQLIAPENTTCYIWSLGCDHDCIDEIRDQL
jgi:Sulfotransferase family